MEYRLYVFFDNKMTKDETDFVNEIITNQAFYKNWLGKQERLNRQMYRENDIADIVDYFTDEKGNYFILVKGRRTQANRLDTHLRRKFMKAMGNARPYNPKQKSHQGTLPFRIYEKTGVSSSCLKDKKLHQELLKEGEARKSHLKSNEKTYYEGRISEYKLLNHIRNRAARNECIKRSGGICSACGINYTGLYGERGKDFLEVHHIKPISQTAGQHVVQIDELCALCPNCHRIVHLKKDDMLSMERIKSIIKEVRIKNISSSTFVEKQYR